MKTKLLLAAALVAAIATAARADGTTIKIATLAPEGSAWMKLFHDWSDAVTKRTNGAVKVKYYAGGVMGDERDVVRKMKLGQVTGAALTAVGLGLISPDVRVLEEPFLFRQDAELDFVRDALDGELRRGFETNGYVLLAWGDVGPMQLFSQLPLKAKPDLARMKMWSWTDDPVMARIFAKLGVTTVSLGVPDVLPSLQTGVIDACYGSALAAVALQWHGKIKYATSVSVSQSIGAVVLAKKTFDALTPEERRVVEEESKTLSTKLVKLVRDDNAAALKKMQTQGIQVVATPEPLLAEIAKAGRETGAEMTGKLYSKEIRARVGEALAKRRGGK